MTSERNGSHRFRVTPDGLVLEVGYSYFASQPNGVCVWKNDYRRATSDDITDPSLLVGVSGS
jgi:hypothetical protein